MNSLKTSIAQGKYLHMRCTAHIVNLIVQECLKEVLESIKRVRAAVRFVKNGTSRLVKFKECAILEKVDTKAFLSLDVCTRWNSTYDMLKAACAYEKVFARYADEDPYFTIELISDKGPGVPDEQDWENARKMAEFLGHFAEITKRVSASLSATSHTYFHEIGEVNILVNNWLNSSDPIQATMGKRMKDKFDKYWGQWHDIVENESEKAKGKEKDKENINLLIFVAVVLDPRYKLSQYTEFAIHQREKRRTRRTSTWRELESLLLQTCCCVEISLIYEPEVLNHIIIVTVLYFCWSVREQLSCIVLMSFHVSWSRGHLGSLDIWILCFVWVICALINWVICCPIFLLNT